jgi:hypothetical protein
VGVMAGRGAHSGDFYRLANRSCIHPPNLSGGVDANSQMR